MADHDMPAGGTFLNAPQVIVSSHAIAAANSPRSSMRDLLRQAAPQQEARAEDLMGPVYVDWRKRPELGYIVNEALKR